MSESLPEGSGVSDAIVNTEMKSTPEALLNATVVKNEVLSPGLFELWVKPDEPIPDFIPGQYIALGLPDVSAVKPKLVKRAYSIASSPLQKDALEFYIASVEGGELSPRLAALQSGDRVFAQKKYVGTFTASSVPDHARVIFVATGTGIAPFISMLRTPETVDRFAKITLLHGVRYAADLAYRPELLAIRETQRDRFEYFATVSREGPPTWSGDQGYVQQFFLKGSIDLHPEQDHVFLCGNPAMITELVDWLTERGFQEHRKKEPGNLHYEKYW